MSDVLAELREEARRVHAEFLKKSNLDIPFLSENLTWAIHLKIDKIQENQEKVNEKVLDELSYLRQTQDFLCEKISKIEKNQEEFNKSILEEMENFRNSIVAQSKSNQENQMEMIEDVVKELRNLKIDSEGNSKIEKGWNGLSDDLKRKCMESMDLRTRYCLRDTSKTERLLIDSTQFHYEMFESCPFLNNFCMAIFAVDSEQTCISCAPPDEKYLMPFLKFIFKTGIFETFIVNFPLDFEFPPEFYNLKLSIRKLEMKQANPRCFGFFMNILDRSFIESIHIFDERKPKWPRVCLIFNAPLLSITKIGENNCICDIARIWIQNNEIIGKRFELFQYEFDSMKLFRMHFGRDAVLQTPRRIRTTMGTIPGKHLLLEMVFEKRNKNNFPTYQFLRLQIIPSDMILEEYEPGNEQHQPILFRQLSFDFNRNFFSKIF